MLIGVGLPTGIPGVRRDEMLSWARQAEALGFSSLATTDRLVYDSWDPLVALAAAAAVTERIALATTILVLPVRGNGAVLAKQAATLQEVSEGRLTLGVGVGARRDDFTTAGMAPSSRGRDLDTAIEEILDLWSGSARGLAGAVGPVPSTRPGLLVGGFVPAAFRRIARFADGWVAAGGPDAIAGLSGSLNEAWRQEKRDGRPRTVAIVYWALGDAAPAESASHLRHYYAFAGQPEHVLANDAMLRLSTEQMANSALTSPETLRSARDAFAAAGCDELILIPTQARPHLLDELAAAVL